jgi:hypothetical protein
MRAGRDALLGERDEPLESQDSQQLARSLTRDIFTIGSHTDLPRRVDRHRCSHPASARSG